MFTVAIFYWDMRRREKARGGDKLSDDKLCLALDTRGAYLDPQVPPPPPRMWEWSSPICSDEMPNFWKVNILQTNTINIWPTGSLLASGREMGAIREEKRGEARSGDNYAAMKAELGRKANTDTGWQWWQLFVRQESRLGSQGLSCDEAANIPHDTEEDESSDTLPPRSWIRRLKGLSILQSAQYKHHDRVTFGCWILLWSGIYYKHECTPFSHGPEICLH